MTAESIGTWKLQSKILHMPAYFFTTNLCDTSPVQPCQGKVYCALTKKKMICRLAAGLVYAIFIY